MCSEEGDIGFIRIVMPELKLQFMIVIFVQFSVRMITIHDSHILDPSIDTLLKSGLIIKMTPLKF